MAQKIPYKTNHLHPASISHPIPFPSHPLQSNQFIAPPTFHPQNSSKWKTIRRIIILNHLFVIFLKYLFTIFMLIWNFKK
jgi:hypothetical protein